MGRVLEDTTDFLGLTDNAGQRHANKMADKQMERANKLTDEQIAFQKEQYNDWKNIYGPLQEDLGTYFKNLNGDTLAAQAITKVQAESQQAQQNIDRSLAQRGLSSSGLEAAALMQNEYNTANQQANIRANADQVANQQKMGFLGLGLGQGSQMLGINAQVSNAGVGSSTSLSSNALNNATSLSQSNSAMMGQLAGTAVGAAGANGMFGSGAQSMFQSGGASGIATIV